MRRHTIKTKSVGRPKKRRKERKECLETEREAEKGSKNRWKRRHLLTRAEEEQCITKEKSKEIKRRTRELGQRRESSSKRKLEQRRAESGSEKEKTKKNESKGANRTKKKQKANWRNERRQKEKIKSITSKRLCSHRISNQTNKTARKRSKLALLFMISLHSCDLIALFFVGCVLRFVAASCPFDNLTYVVPYDRMSFSTSVFFCCVWLFCSFLLFTRQKEALTTQYLRQIGT